MSTLSRVADECKKCPNVKRCNNKRMVACALADMPKMSLSKNTMKPNTMPVIQVALRDTSVQAQIAEKLKKDFYKEIFDINCVFNKS